MEKEENESGHTVVYNCEFYAKSAFNEGDNLCTILIKAPNKVLFFVNL